MDNRNAGLDGDFLQVEGDGLQNMLGVQGLALENHPECEDGVVPAAFGQPGGHDGDFKGAGNADDQDVFGTGAGGAQFAFGGGEKRFDKFGVVLGADDGEAPVACRCGLSG
jgi:hypothetical protein